jgi:hypothetical protein
MRLWAAAGFEQGFWPMATALMVIAGLSVVPVRFGKVPAATAVVEEPSAPTADASLWRWDSLLFVVFLALLALRFTVILEDNLLRPLFSWDSWMNWAPKARIWFEIGELVPFVGPDAWTKGASLDGTFTIGNSQAWNYPITVPLIMLWTALGLDAWHDDLIKLPWVLCGIALALGVYGQFRHFGASRGLSMVLIYLLLSMPYLNIHMLLAGYAEIWLATALCFGFLAYLRWRETRSWRDLGLILAFVLLCIMLKRPGLIWGLVLLLAVVADALPRRLMLATLVAAFVAITGVLLLGGIDVTVPGIGQIRLAPEGITLPYLGSQSWQFTNISPRLLDSLFLSPNWHLFWYAATGLVISGIFTKRLRFDLAGPLLFVTGTVGTFVLIFYFIPRYSNEALSLITLNRAILHLVPTLFVFLVWWIHATRARQVGTITVPSAQASG